MIRVARKGLFCCYYLLALVWVFQFRSLCLGYLAIEYLRHQNECLLFKVAFIIENLIVKNNKKLSFKVLSNCLTHSCLVSGTTRNWLLYITWA